MKFAEQYYHVAQTVICKIVETQMAALEKASSMVADTIARDGIIYTLGSGHPLMVATELYYRAGGLANFDVIHDRTFGRAERLTGYAKVLLESYPVSPRDLLIVVSNSGRNCLPIEMELRKEIFNLRQLLNAAIDKETRRELQRELNLLVLEFNVKQRRGVAFDLPQAGSERA